MNKAVRRLLLGASIVLGLLAVIAVGIGLFFNLDNYKPQIESAVAKATGMQLKINGKAKFSFFPVGIALYDVHLVNRGSELFDASEIRIAPRFGAFVLHRDLVVDKVSLVSPKIRIEKTPKGHMNYETAKVSSKSSAEKRPSSAQLRAVSIKNGDLSYLDQSTGKKAQLSGVDASFSGIAAGSGLKAGGDLMKSLSFRGSIRAKALTSDALVASNLKSEIRDDHGLFQLDPTEATVFGGVVHGKAQIDLRGAVPKLEMTQKASSIDLSQLPMKKKSWISGIAEGAVSLTASGKDRDTILKTAKGNVSIRSPKIVLSGVDVDDLVSKLKTAQGLDIVGQAAGIAAGGSETKTEIKSLVSDWKIADGVAEAKDVAFSTPKNIVAFKGNVNLVTKSFQNFYVATVDSKGCSKTKVEIVGSLNKPRPSAGSVGEQISKSYPGQVGSAIGSIFGSKDEAKRGAEKNIPAGCDHFYSGAAIERRSS